MQPETEEQSKVGLEQEHVGERKEAESKKVGN